MPTAEIISRAREIRLVLTDCDGVLTDGRLHYTPAGEQDKIFHVHDGLGFKLARQAGLKTGIISGRRTEALALRARELEVDYLYQGREAKLSAYEEIRSAENLADDGIAYLGDDWHDLALLARAGLAIAVADAVSEVRARAHFVTVKGGGQGAFREAVALILQAQGHWPMLLRQFDGP